MIFEKLVHDLLNIINSIIISILIIIRIRHLRDRGFQPHQPQVVFSNWQTKARGISTIQDKQIGYILPHSVISVRYSDLFSNKSPTNDVKIYKNNKSGTQGAAECVTDIFITFLYLPRTTTVDLCQMESICFIC